jgi:hypothetical protein
MSLTDMFGCTEFCYCSVQHVQVIEKVHGVHSEPLIQIFAVRELDRQPQVPRTLHTWRHEYAISAGTSTGVVY